MIDFLNLSGGTVISEKEARGIGGMNARNLKVELVRQDRDALRRLQKARENAHLKARKAAELEPVDEQLLAMEKLRQEGYLSESEFEDIKEQIQALTLVMPPPDDEEEKTGEEKTGVRDGDYNSTSKDPTTARLKNLATEERRLGDQDEENDDELRVLAARYLLASMMLDALAWGVGKIALVEVIRFGRTLGYPVVLTTLALSAAEAAIELGASAAVPRLYDWYFAGKRIKLDNGDLEENSEGVETAGQECDRSTASVAYSARRLTKFAVAAYTVSSAVALVAYPICLFLLQVQRVRTPATFLLFAVIQAIQYPLMNQLGDQAVEMALPHWLATFEGLVLTWPGFTLVDKWKCHRAAKICCIILCSSEESKTSSTEKNVEKDNTRKTKSSRCSICCLCKCILFYICCCGIFCSCCWRCLFGGGKHDNNINKNKGKEKRSDDDNDDSDEHEADDDIFHYFDDDEHRRKKKKWQRERILEDKRLQKLKGDSNDESEDQARQRLRRSERSQWRNNLIISWANADSLAYFVNLGRFVCAAVVTLLYVSCGDDPALRWLVLISLSITSFVAAHTLHVGFSYIENGIVDKTVGENKKPTPWLCNMKGGELGLVAFAVVIFTVPSDASAAALAVLYVTLSSSFRTAIVALGGIGVIIYLTKKVKNAGGLDDDMLEDELAALLERERSNAAKEEQKRLKKQKKNGGGDGGSALPPLPSVDMTPSIMPKSSSLLRKKDTTTLTSTVGASEVNPIAFHPDHNLVIDVQGPAAQLPQHTIDQTSNSKTFSLFDIWLRQYALIVCILSLSAMCIYIASASLPSNYNEENDKLDDDSRHENGGDDDEDDENVSKVALFLLLMGGVFLLPYFSLNFDLQSRFDTILFQYKEGQASGIIYYRNVFEVFLKIPVLVVNWYVLKMMDTRHNNDDGINADDDEVVEEAEEAEEERLEQQTGSYVLGACVAILLLAFAYFGIVDRQGLIGRERSAATIVDRTGAALAKAATMTAARKVLIERLMRERKKRQHLEELKEEKKRKKRSRRKKKGGDDDSSSSSDSSTSSTSTSDSSSSDEDNGNRISKNSNQHKKKKNATKKAKTAKNGKKSTEKNQKGLGLRLPVGQQHQKHQLFPRERGESNAGGGIELSPSAAISFDQSLSHNNDSHAAAI